VKAVHDQLAANRGQVRQTRAEVCEAEHGPAHEEFIRITEEGEVEQ
jgi:hypothetical protein